MRDYEDILPEEIAIAQKQWDRNRVALRMRECGLSLKEAAARLGLTTARVQQLIHKAKMRELLEERSPLERYLSGEGASEIMQNLPRRPLSWTKYLVKKPFLKEDYLVISRLWPITTLSLASEEKDKAE